MDFKNRKDLEDAAIELRVRIQLLEETAVQLKEILANVKTVVEGMRNYETSE